MVCYCCLFNGELATCSANTMYLLDAELATCSANTMDLWINVSEVIPIAAGCKPAWRGSIEAVYSPLGPSGQVTDDMSSI